MEDALNQSTENDDKLEPEEEGNKAVAVTHLPSKGTAPYGHYRGK